jgi:hypothetical protein
MGRDGCEPSQTEVSMKRYFSLVLICIIFASCVTVPYDTNKPRYIVSRGTSFGASLIPGFTQFLNGEYLKGSLKETRTIALC